MSGCRSDFNDIHDSSSNNETGSNPTHYQAVTGYDLATGLGSPRIGLLNDLAGASAPLAQNMYTSITFTVGTGGDDLRCTSTATADLLDSTCRERRTATGILYLVRLGGGGSGPPTNTTWTTIYTCP